MKTLEEIKDILCDNHNYGELLKDAILQKFGENKLISCNGYKSHELGDANGYLNAVVVSNGVLFVYTSMRYRGEDFGFCFGALETNIDLLNNENEFASQDSLKKFTNKVIENGCVIEYDFDNEWDEIQKKNNYFYFLPSIWLKKRYYDNIKEIIANGKGRIICEE